MVRMLYCTGMSQSQVCGLHWSDIDFGRCTIVLCKDPDSNVRQRIIPLDYRVEPDMLLLKEVTMALLGRHYSDREQVFRVQLFYFGFFGNRMSPDQVTDLLSRLTPDTGMTVALRCIQHRNANLGLNGGREIPDVPMPLELLNAHMGHSDIMTTARNIIPKDDS